jgi:hypothetical protein
MKMKATTGCRTALATGRLCPRMSSWDAHQKDCGPSAPSTFLIANARLKFRTNSRKQRLLQISNRERIAIFSHVSQLVSASITALPSSFNRQFGKLKNHVSLAISALSQFLIGTRSGLFRMLPYHSFSPRQTVSRDMIPALTPLK